MANNPTSVDLTHQPGALCGACGAVIFHTPMNPQHFFDTDADLPVDACPFCTITDWKPVKLARVRVERTEPAT